MSAPGPQPGRAATQHAFAALPDAAEAFSMGTTQIASVVRAVVLLTVALMLRVRPLSGPAAPPDLFLALAAGYVLVTTLLPGRSAPGPLIRVYLVCDIILISGLIWCTGGTRSEYYLLYYLPIIHGALRLDFRDAVTMSLLAAVSYLFIAIATGPLVPVVTNSILRAATFGGSVLVLAAFFAALAHEARANRALTVRLREALDSVSAVYDVARAANTRDSMDEVLTTVLRQAVRLSDAEAGALALLDEEGRFHVLARHGEPDCGGEELDEAMARQALESRQWTSRAAPGARAGACQELFVPLFAGRHALGVIQVWGRAQGGIGPREIESLRALCAEAAMAIENVRLRAETRRAAALDYLTGLYNRREFERRLEAEIRRCARHGGGVSLVLLDADEFKLCNDRYGHPAGDQVLQALAARMQAVIRSEDTAARYGGDEFAIILPETDAAGARVVAEKIQRELRSLRFGWADGAWRLTVSIGVAASEDELSASLLLQKADRALYQAKYAGKNQICVWRRGAHSQLPGVG